MNPDFDWLPVTWWQRWHGRISHHVDNAIYRLLSGLTRFTRYVIVEKEDLDYWNCQHEKDQEEHARRESIHKCEMTGLERMHKARVQEYKVRVLETAHILIAQLRKDME